MPVLPHPSLAGPPTLLGASEVGAGLVSKEKDASGIEGGGPNDGHGKRFYQVWVLNPYGGFQVVLERAAGFFKLCWSARQAWILRALAGFQVVRERVAGFFRLGGSERPAFKLCGGERPAKAQDAQGSHPVQEREVCAGRAVPPNPAHFS